MARRPERTGFQEITLGGKSEPPRVEPYDGGDRSIAFQDIAAEVTRNLDVLTRHLAALQARTAKVIAESEATLATCRRSRIRSGVRPRASRGRAVRLHGSRRGRPTATRAGPDPDPGESDRPSREGAAT